jgi:hypothetical protein
METKEKTGKGIKYCHYETYFFIVKHACATSIYMVGSAMTGASASFVKKSGAPFLAQLELA